MKKPLPTKVTGKVTNIRRQSMVLLVVDENLHLLIDYKQYHRWAAYQTNVCLVIFFERIYGD
uniref:Uncharacterized protein n=1 Tax=Megaselia scalaris TaxID=36166 RepID=T1GUC6_MEGSC